MGRWRGRYLPQLGQIDQLPATQCCACSDNDQRTELITQKIKGIIRRNGLTSNRLANALPPCKNGGGKAMVWISLSDADVSARGYQTD